MMNAHRRLREATATTERRCDPRGQVQCGEVRLEWGTGRSSCEPESTQPAILSTHGSGRARGERAEQGAGMGAQSLQYVVSSISRARRPRGPRRLRSPMVLSTHGRGREVDGAVDLVKRHSGIVWFPSTLNPSPLHPTPYALHPVSSWNHGGYHLIKSSTLNPSLLHPTPYTLHPTPYTLHPTPCTLHPTPYTLHPTPYTLHPTPCTLHPTPCTLHPTPFALAMSGNH